MCQGFLDLTSQTVQCTRQTYDTGVIAEYRAMESLAAQLCNTIWDTKPMMQPSDQQTLETKRLGAGSKHIPHPGCRWEQA